MTAVKVVHGLPGLPEPLSQSVLTIGNFDGVHAGHQAILARVRDLARSTDGPSAVLTFEPHPLAVLRPEHAPERIQSPQRKLAILGEQGVDYVVVADADAGLLGMTADAFVREVIVGQFQPRHVVEGFNFGFGHNREGDVATLQAAAPAHGFSVHVVDPIQQALPADGERRVSSSLIRFLLTEGDVETAARALGRPHVLEGVVVEGARRGRQLGFPTANLQAANLVPRDGVYAGTTEVAGRSYRCAVSIGSTPTFGHASRQVEAHLLDFSGDLYHQPINLALHARVRDQQKFDDVASLVEQIQRDVSAVREIALAFAGG